MKLHLDRAADSNVVREYQDGWVVINEVRYTHPVMVTPASVEIWEGLALGALARITVGDLEPLLAGGTEVVIVGTGLRQRFLPPQVVTGLARRRVGVEVMNTRAACRTYNVLASDRRRVAALLFHESRAGG